MQEQQSMEGENKTALEEQKGQAEIEQKEEGKKKRFSKHIDTRMIALFVIGILVGITLKTQAVKSITMGYDDYRLENTKSDFVLTKSEDEEEAEEPSENENEETQELQEGEARNETVDEDESLTEEEAESVKVTE